MEPGRKNNKIIVILGPTSSGKSDIAIRLAKKFDGEIISADSRQIYRGMDVGTGKIPKSKCKNQKSKSQFKSKKLIPYWSDGISHYLIDIISPRTNYNAAKFKRDAGRIITDILKRKKLPIICGGTGFWIKAIVDDIAYPKVKPDPVLRNILCNKTAEELFLTLKKIDPDRASNIDAKNKVRLIRAIEICKALGKVPPSHPSPPLGEMSRTRDREGSKQNHEFLQIGISLSKEKLQKNIKKRLKQRFKSGMIEEVRRLHFENKIPWKRLESFGLGYGLIPKYLREEISSEDELFKKIFQAEKDYAKRQMTWFRKDIRIKWLATYQEIESVSSDFLKK